MTATTDTRKRSREDDGSDPMPLSKRINNLHINNNNNNHNLTNNNYGFENSHLNQNGDLQQLHHQNIQNGYNEQRIIYEQHQQHLIQLNNHHHQQQQQAQHHHHHHQQQQQHLNDHQSIEDYSPELSQQENPYYYNKNKLLYELHSERLRRSHHHQ